MFARGAVRKLMTVMLVLAAFLLACCGGREANRFSAPEPPAQMIDPRVTEGPDLDDEPADDAFRPQPGADDWNLDYTDEPPEPEVGPETPVDAETSEILTAPIQDYSFLVTTTPNFSEQVGRYDPFVPVDPIKLDPLLGVQLFPDDYRMSGYIDREGRKTAVLSMGDSPFVVRENCVIHDALLMCNDLVLVNGRWRQQGDEYAAGQMIDIEMIKQEGIWVKEITREFTVLYREHEGEPREVKVRMKRRKREPPRDEATDGFPEADTGDISDLYVDYLKSRYEDRTTDASDFSDYLEKRERDARKPRTYIEQRRDAMTDTGSRPSPTPGE